MCRTWSTALAALGLLVACDPYPPFDAEGERVVLATDFVPTVCAGTLANLDRQVEYVEGELDLPKRQDRLRVAVLGLDTATELCELSSACVKAEGDVRIVVLTPGEFERSARHEFVHARLPLRASGSIPLFREGVAEALELATCPWSGSSRDPEELLLASTDELRRSGRLAGGELLAWLLDVHGPAVVFDFLASLQRDELLEPRTPSDEVRELYRQHFGSEYDDDIHAHTRDIGALSAEAPGCMGETISETSSELRLQTDFVCSSPRVQNDFRVPGRGFVDWRFEVASTQRYVLTNQLAAGTRVSIKRCTCNFVLADPDVSWDEDSLVGAFAELTPGTYQIRLSGPLDSGVGYDIAIAVQDVP